MQIDVSFLPAYAAAFMLSFARIGTMVMLLPGLGEMTVSPRVRLTIALVLTAVIMPLHRTDYQIDLRALLCAFVRTIETTVVAVNARSLKRLPARRQETADRRAGFEIARAQACCSQVSFRLAAQTTRNARYIRTPIAAIHEGSL